MLMDEVTVTEAADEMAVETALPEPSDNGPRPEDGLQPTPEEEAALVAAILAGEDEEEAE